MIHLGIVINSYLKTQHGASNTIGHAREATITLQTNNKPSLTIKSIFNNIFILVNTLLYSTHISDAVGFQTQALFFLKINNAEMPACVYLFNWIH